MFWKAKAAWKNKEFLLGDDGIIDQAGIKESYRKAYFFINKENYVLDGTVRSGKLFLINASMSHTNTNRFVNSGNFLRFVINMYTFQVDFLSGIQDLNNAICKLEEAYSNDAYNDLDNKKYFRDNLLMYDDNYSVNSSDLKEFLVNAEYEADDTIPEPKYYTSAHQLIETGEEPYPLNMNVTSLIYRFEELRDHNTLISIIPMEHWYSFVALKLNKLRTVREDSDYHGLTSNAKNFIEDLFYYNAEVVLEGLIFSYDSSVGDVAIHHHKSLPVTMSFSNHRFDQQKIDFMLKMKSMIKDNMKEIEKDYGNILMFYSPYMHGDHFDLTFRDYRKDNQPFNLNKVDKMFGLDTAVSTVLSEVNESI